MQENKDNTEKKENNLRALRKYRKYNAYQCAFEVVQGTEHKLNAKDRYRMTVLYVMDWFKKRDAKSNGKEGNDFNPDLYGVYPAPEEYEKFDTMQIKDINPGESEGISIIHYAEDAPGAEEECWALQIDEPGDGNSTVTTEASIRLFEDKVLLAVRGLVRMPADSDMKIPFYRPAFIRSIILQYKYLRLAEYGLDARYIFHSAHGVRINGRNSEECKFFLDNMLDNPNRQLPVFLISVEGFEKFGGEFAYMPKKEEEEKTPDEGGADSANTVDGESDNSADDSDEGKTEESVTGQSDNTDSSGTSSDNESGKENTEEESAEQENKESTEEEPSEAEPEKKERKPLELQGFKKSSKKSKHKRPMDYKFLGPDVIRDNIDIRPKFMDKPPVLPNGKELNVKTNEENAVGKERMIIDAAAGAAIGYAHFCVIEGSVRKLCVGTKYEQYIPRLEAGELILLGSEKTIEDYTEYFALNERKQMNGTFMDEMRRKMETLTYEFRDIEFYGDLRIRKSEKDIRIMLSDGEKDPEVLVRNINEQRQTISDLQEEKKQMEADYRMEKEALNEEIAGYKSEAEKWKREFDKLNSHQGRIEEKHEEIKKEKEALEKNMELSGENKAVGSVVKDLSGHAFIRGMDGILNLPADVKFKKDDFEDWVKRYYSETIVLHEKAVKSFKKAELTNDRLQTLAAMIHFLHGCTVYWNNGMWDLTKDHTVADNYDIYRCGFELSKSSDITLKKYRTKYTIDISEIDDKKGEVLIGDHIKYHNGHDLDLVRLYYYYDKDIKKSVIGYMPDHLDTVSEGPK